MTEIDKILSRLAELERFKEQSKFIIAAREEGLYDRILRLEEQMREVRKELDR